MGWTNSKKKMKKLTKNTSPNSSPLELTPEILKRCTPSVTLQSGLIQHQRSKLRRPSIKNDGTGPDFPTLKERTQLRKRRPPSSVLKPPRNNFVLFVFTVSSYGTLLYCTWI